MTRRGRGFDRAGMAAFIAILCCLGGANAWANDEPQRTVAILDFVLEGSGPPELRPELERGLELGLRDSGVSVISRDEITRRLADAPELQGCTTITCLERVATKVGSSEFARARVHASGAAYVIALELLSAASGATTARRVEKSCPVCTIGEATEAVSQAARELVKSGGPALLPVQVRSEPSGAQVMVDDRVLGTTPLSIELSPGRYVFRVSLPGHAVALKDVELGRGAPDDPTSVTVRLLPLARPASPHQHPGWMKWGTASVALAAMAAGVALIVTDGRVSDCPGTPRDTCRQVADTALAGWIAAGTGAVLAGVSVWLFVDDAGPAIAAPTGTASSGPAPAATSARPRGPGVGVSLRF